MSGGDSSITVGSGDINAVACMVEAAALMAKIDVMAPIPWRSNGVCRRSGGNYGVVALA